MKIIKYKNEFYPYSIEKENEIKKDIANFLHKRISIMDRKIITTKKYTKIKDNKTLYTYKIFFADDWYINRTGIIQSSYSIIEL